MGGHGCTGEEEGGILCGRLTSGRCVRRRGCFFSLMGLFCGSFSLFGGSGGGGGRTDVNVVNRRGSLHELSDVPNQDSWYIVRGGGEEDEEEWVSVGVFDGHGDQGHHASELAARAVRDSVKKQWEERSGEGGDMEERGVMMEVLKTAFLDGNEEIRASNYSSSAGCTATVVIVCGATAVVGTVGDSAAAVLRRTGPKVQKLELRWASIDHRLDVTEERERISRAGGIIYDHYVVDKVEKNKVRYLTLSNSLLFSKPLSHLAIPKPIPLSPSEKGLMVTRTMGDIDMRQNGVIDEPTTMEFDLQDGIDLFIIAASDGLWDANGMSIEKTIPVVEK